MPRRHRGDGSVYFDRANGTWIAAYPVGGRYKKARASSKLAAKQELERLARAHSRDVDPAAGTLDTYLARWLTTLHDVREATRVSYAGHVNNHISPLLGGIPVARLRPADVSRLIADRLSAGLSPSTVRRIHATLHAALGQGVRERALGENVAHNIRLPKPEERLVEAMTEDAADQIREAVSGTFLEPLVELLLGSGLRLGEALGLDQGDVRGNVVMVRRSKTRQRAVVISDDAAEALRAHIVALPIRGAQEPVFWGLRGQAKKRRLRGSSALHAFQRALSEAGLPHYRLHDLRHGVASLMVARGVHMRVVSDQLGHSNPAFTARVYAHVAPAQIEEAVRLLNRRVK